MRLSMIVATLLCLVGCKGDPTQPEVPAVLPGNYALTAVGGKALPVTIIADTGYTIEITAGALGVKTDSSFTYSLTTRETVAGHPSLYVDRLTGTWTTPDKGATLVFRSVQDSTARNATWSHTTLTLMVTDSAVTTPYVYTRAP